MNDPILATGGKLYGQDLGVEFVENAVYIVDGEHYVCKTIYGQRAFMFVDKTVFDYLYVLEANEELTDGAAGSILYRH